MSAVHLRQLASAVPKEQGSFIEEFARCHISRKKVQAIRDAGYQNIVGSIEGRMLA